MVVKNYRGLIVRKESDGRFDIYEDREHLNDDRPLNENFQTLGLAMTWIDSV